MFKKTDCYHFFYKKRLSKCIIKIYFNPENKSEI
jgi:hypothetical protein